MVYRLTILQLHSIGCDSVALNDVMVEELKKLVEGFCGEAAWVHCFSHVINLVAKSVIKQFDVPKNGGKDVVDEALATLRGLVGDLEDDNPDDNDPSAAEDNEAEGDVNVEGWVDEQDVMVRADIEKLDAEVQLMCLLLFKVCHSLKPHIMM